ncbi:MAG TPA: HD domain-containing phosphohydrolase [Gemmatimonadaceae bacterium]|nr:HD domain-containing phosphohydrolase [Gemmatimonadaceae bacterium]
MATTLATLSQARERERAGRLDAAIEDYVAVAAGAGTDIAEVEARCEALRRHAMIRRRRQEYGAAIALCEESYHTAMAANLSLMASRALNNLGIVHMDKGSWDSALDAFERGLTLGGHDPGTRASIEQNCGIVANIRGDFTTALDRYQRALAAFAAVGDDRGCALVNHNLGMICADLQRWEAADGHFASALSLMDKIGEPQLRANALLMRTEIHLARQRYEDARQGAEEALRIFDELGVRQGRSEAYRFLGMMYRETGAPALAEARLRSAMKLASDAGTNVEEAEATRELAVLYQQLNRNQDALTLLNMAHRLFQRSGAQADLKDVTTKVADLERIYLDLVATWGRSIESADGYTHGHCERVAQYAATVATRLGLNESMITAVRVGAYLHDVGKVRVPHEILNKPGRLTPEEREVMEQHTIYGIELLASIEFPWPVKPIIRSHHEKQDGSGYPDRLRGDEVPLTAQIIGIVDMYDALTTTRSYRKAMSHDEAVAEINKCAHWWRPDVVSAFLTTIS